MNLFCADHVWAWRLWIQPAGDTHVVEVCAECGERRYRNQTLGKDVVRAAGIDPETLAVWLDQRADAPPCERCGELGTQEHHWAPKHIFGSQEADFWPIGRLCRRCHALWHDRVTPRMSEGPVQAAPRKAGLVRATDLLAGLAVDPALPPRVRATIEASIQALEESA